jgi:hypothetical protein
MADKDHPKAIDPKRVGSYPAPGPKGTGYFYDHVAEYRVWNNTEEEPTFKAFATYLGQ